MALFSKKEKFTYMRVRGIYSKGAYFRYFTEHAVEKKHKHICVCIMVIYGYIHLYGLF